MTTNNSAYYPYRTPHGLITIGAQDNAITDIVFGNEVLSGDYRPTELTNRAATELLEYFAGKRRGFDLPLSLEGSEFQRAVWEELTRTPYGTSRTSADIACALGKPSAHRSVGAALNKNKLAILVPDHRIVGAAGNHLGAGTQARLRRALFEFEKEHRDTTR